MSLENFVIKNRLIIIIIFPLLSLIMLLGIPHLEIEANINDLIPKDMTSRIQTDHIDSIFGSNNLVIVVLEADDILSTASLTRLKKLTRAFQRQKGIERVNSLFTLKHIKNENGIMIVNPAIEKIPKTNIHKEKLRGELLQNSLVMGTVVSEDFNKSAILITPEKHVDENVLLSDIENILKEIPGNEKIYSGGLAVVNATIIKDIFKDITFLLPIGFILMSLMLFLAFRQIRGILLPFGAVLMSMVLSFSLMPILAWKIAIVTILMPVMLIAVANDYGIHMVAKYNELQSNFPQWDNKQLSASALKHLKHPILITGITTVVGILALLVHVIIHARQLGILTSLGIIWAVLLSLLFIPACQSYLPKRNTKTVVKHYKNSFLEKLLKKTGKMITHHPRKILIVSLGLCILMTLGIINLKIDGNVENFFKEKHSIKQSSQLINKDFGGSQTLSILFEGDIKDPLLLKRMQDYEAALLDNEDVGKVTSILNALREISKGLYSKNHPKYKLIPNTREAVAQYLELYYMNGDPDDFEQLINFSNTGAQMIVRINKSDGFIINKVVNEIRELSKNDPYVSMLGGEALITSDMNLAIVKGQIKSLILAILAIIIVLVCVFRSIKAGIFASIPLLLAEIFLFGVMGYSGIRLDAATALLSSLMIGIGIDYTIHFLWRYREEYSSGQGAEASIHKTLIGSGKGIIFNAWSVIMGFAALMFSSFKPIQYFGFLVVLSVSVCLMAALILVPAMCLVFKPKFLEPKEIK